MLSLADMPSVEVEAWLGAALLAGAAEGIVGGGEQLQRQEQRRAVGGKV